MDYHIKQEFIENKLILSEYTSKDLEFYPAWTFLLPDVTEVYGICPYLNVDVVDCNDRRIKWLHDTFDKGKTYYTLVSDKRNGNKIDAEFEQDKIMLQKKVQDALQEYNVTNDNVTNGWVDYNELIEQVTFRATSKSINKQSKNIWINTLSVIEDVSKGCNFDFLKYTKCMYNLHIRHKFITDDKSELNVLIDNCTKKYNQYIKSCEKYSIDKHESQERLVSLIKSNFQLDQIGRYFKRWSNLTLEKKNERIKSYLYWYIQNSNGELDVNIIDQAYTFVQQKIKTKEIKTNDILWNSKLGVITSIKNLVVTDNQFTISKVSTSSSVSKVNTSVPITLKVQQKIHRLLLLEILKSNVVYKQKIIENVVFNTSCITLGIKKDVLYKYIISKYEKFLKIIMENPIPTSASSTLT